MAHEVEEFIQSPFIARDGRDPSGVRAEVKVFTGKAIVSDITRPKNKKSTMRSYGFSIETSDYPTKGWLDTEKDEEIANILEKAYEDDTHVYFRIEAQRKNNVDRSLSFADITKDKDDSFKNTFRYVVAVRVGDEGDWVVGSHMVTSFTEDPSIGGTYRATAEDVGGTSSHEGSGHSGDSGDRGANTSQRSRGAMPWAVRQADGSINPNSYAVTIPVDVLSFVEEITSTGEWAGTFTSGQKRTITTKLLGAAAIVQRDTLLGSDDEEIAPRIDMGAYSFRVAVGIIKDVVKLFVPMDTFFTPGEELEEEDFQRKLVDYCADVRSRSSEIAAWSLTTVGRLDGR